MKAKLAKLAKADRRSASQMAVILLEEALGARAGKKGLHHRRPCVMSCSFFGPEAR